MSATPEWFREWFGETYLSLYPHRDEEEAAEGVALFGAESGLPAGARVLDLACGAGRHLASLREAGYEAVGIDLSLPLLREAAERSFVGGSLVRADMRAIPFADGTFDGLVNFFTSFGYFLTPEEDRAVLGEVRRLLRPGAPFLLDYLNVHRVLARLEPETVGEINGRRVRQTRWVEDDHVLKRIEIDAEAGGPPEIFHERVRLYPPPALEGLLRDAGLRPDRRFGGYDGRGFDEAAPRFLVVGTAE